MKHILITGATGGIGHATAMQLADQGHKLTIHGRSAAKLAAVKAEILAQTGNENVETLVADLSSLKSVAEAVSAFAARTQTLDVLINNAGVSPFEKQLTQNGFEMNFGVNTLATLLLTQLLLPVLKQTPGARIVFVASNAWSMGQFDIEDIDLLARPYKMMQVYGTSKLYSIFLSNTFSQLLQQDDITVNALHPGVVKSSLFNDTKGLMGLFNTLLGRFFFSTPEKGAQTSVFLAVSGAVADTSGKYFSNSREKALKPDALNRTHSEAVWDLANRLIQPYMPVRVVQNG